MSKYKLKPCPFCGGKVKIIELEVGKGQCVYLVSRGVGENPCRCRVFMESNPFEEGTSEIEKRRIEKALAYSWNRRA